MPKDLVEIQENYLAAWRPPPRIVVHNAEEAMRVLQDARDSDVPQIKDRTMLAVQLWLTKLIGDCELER